MVGLFFKNIMATYGKARSGNVWLGMIYFDLSWFGTAMCGSVRQYTARLFFQKHHGNVRYGGFCLGGFKLGWVRRGAARLFFQNHQGKAVRG